MSFKCVHGYFTHQYIKCPWCHGFDSSNQNIVPVVGKGNGWLLEKGKQTCPDCGGPAGAGCGLIPDDWTHEYFASLPLLCYECAKERGRTGKEIPHYDPPEEVKKEAAKRKSKIVKEMESRKKEDIRRSKLQEYYPERF